MNNQGNHAPFLQRSGFALLITITLLAFLVLVLVSLATLTRVETHVASNGQRLSQARQNALMALNIALGQLQKYTGPDQRVTAPADLVADTDKLGVASYDSHPRFTGGKQNVQPLAPTVGGTAYAPRIIVQPGMRYWTGVWGNSRPASYTLKPNSPEFTPANRGGLTPVQLGWLVSGNEQSSFTSKADGSVTAPSASQAPAFTPALSVSNLTTTSKATDNNLTFPVADSTIVTGGTTTRGILLVGPNSVLPQNAAANEQSAALQDYVVAPTVAITAPENTISGLGTGSSPVEIGRYAWWVSDEGVKARVNLQNGYQNAKTSSAAQQTAAQINSFIVAQRATPEFMAYDRLTSTNLTGTRLGPDYKFTATGIPNVQLPAQLAFLGADSNAQSHLRDAARNRFHDLTTLSMGVLSDTYAGGLKKDITADLADTSLDYSYRPADSNSIFPALSSDSGTHLPVWSNLRSWARLNPTSPGGTIDPTTADARAAGITPTIAHLSLGMDYFLGLKLGGSPVTVASPPLQPGDNTYTGVRLKFALYPIIALHNPYSLPLGPVDGGSIDYDLGIRLTHQARFIVETDHAGDKSYIQVADINLSTCTVSAVGASAATETFFRFRVHLTAPIPPGERHVFMLQAADDETEYHRDTPPTLIRVPQDGQSAAIKQYVFLNGPELIPSPYISGTSDPRMTNAQSHIRVRAPNLNYADAQENSSFQFIQISAVLAEKNALSSPTWDTSTSVHAKWNQAILNVFPGIFRMTGADMPNGTSYSKGSTFFTKIGEIWSSGEVFPANQVDANGISLGDTLEASELTDKAMGALHLNAFHKEGGVYDFLYRGASGDHYHPRFIANASLRAPFIQATEMENTKDKFLPTGITSRAIPLRRGAIIFGATIHSCGADMTNNSLQEAGTGDAQLWRNDLKNESIAFGDSYNAYKSGSTTLDGDVPGHRHRAVLWDLLDSKDNLLSLGQFQHALLSPWVFNSSYLFGNSLADVHVYRNSTYTDSLFVPPEGGPAQPGYDLSWLLNRQIWDKYFVSGVPSGWTQGDIDAAKPLPNARMSFYRRNAQSPALSEVRHVDSNSKAYDRAAANLLVAGSFNINSTSEQAWRAILAGTSGLPQNNAYASSTDMVDTAIPYPRFTHNLAVAADAPYIAYPITMRPDPLMSSFVNPAVDPNAFVSDANNYVQKYFRPILYYGNRGLYLNMTNGAGTSQPSAEAVVNELARSIVREVRRRGPFLSLADFVNRPLTPTPSSSAAEYGDERLLAGIKGALQAALEKMDPAVAQVNPWEIDQRLEGSYPEIRYMTAGAYQYIDDIGLKQHLIGGYGTQDKAINDPYGQAETHRSILTLSPKYLSQADLLSSLGPQLSARSDTFTIRAYGETRNPVSNATEGRAWCEAVVQRVPDYSDAAGNNAWDATGSLNSANRNFGRKFQIVSFRWLSPDEI